MQLHITIFIISTFISLVFLFLYKKVGTRLKIYDVPNERSSHKDIVIRGAGVILILVNVALFFLAPSEANMLLGLSICIGVLTGFVDDFKNLRAYTRFLLYLSAVAIILLGVLDLLRFDSFIWVPLFIVLLGAVNTYNFMDGINGITALYSFTFLVSSYFILEGLGEHEFLTGIVLYCSFFVAFSFFNVRKRALMFLGDSGSVAMGLFSAFVVVLIGIKLSNWTPILLLSVYGVDSVGTIIIRLIKKENVLKAHRSHLYQDLVHLKNRSHLQISTIYALVQLVVNGVFYLLLDDPNLQYYAIGILLGLGFTFVILKRNIYGKLLFER